jgi:hypothetical protein
MSSWSPLFLSSKLKSKLRWAPIIEDNEYFAPKHKDIHLFFSGFMTLDRLRLGAVAGYHMTCAGLHARVSLHKLSRSQMDAIPDHEYRDHMRRAMAVLNVSTKGSKDKRVAIINGRTWETFAARAALIQYSPPENDSLALNEYFTPGEEYFQFSSEKELIKILSLFRDDPQRIDEVAGRGHERYLNDYPAHSAWARLLR